MAGEIGALSVKILYAPETTAGTRPTTGYKAKATSGTLDIADFVTGASGFSADIDQGEVTPISTPQYGRRSFIPLLYGNDGSIKLTCNVNKESRTSWNAICDEHAALMLVMFAFFLANAVYGLIQWNGLARRASDPQQP